MNKFILNINNYLFNKIEKRVTNNNNNNNNNKYWLVFLKMHI